MSSCAIRRRSYEPGFFPWSLYKLKTLPAFLGVFSTLCEDNRFEYLLFVLGGFVAVFVVVSIINIGGCCDVN